MRRRPRTGNRDFWCARAVARRRAVCAASPSLLAYACSGRTFDVATSIDANGAITSLVATMATFARVATCDGDLEPENCGCRAGACCALCRRRACAAGGGRGTGCFNTRVRDPPAAPRRRAHRRADRPAADMSDRPAPTWSTDGARTRSTMSAARRRESALVRRRLPTPKM